MKETTWRRMTVTSSINEISMDQLGNREVVRGGKAFVRSPQRILNGA
jgi:hypothetical protein